MYNQHKILRVFQLINLLKAKPSKSIRSLAKTLAIDNRTIYRYFDLLREVGVRVAQAGFQIGNIDATIVAQAPRMAPHIALMRERIAQALGVAVGQVNVKAKTAEKLGPVGQGQSMEARAVALLTCPA